MFLFFNVSETIILEHTFSLANAGSTVIIGEQKIAVMPSNYTTYVKTVKEGKNIRKTNTGEWQESLVDGGNPGRSNMLMKRLEKLSPMNSPKTAEITLSANIDEIIYLNNQYTSLFL